MNGLDTSDCFDMPLSRPLNVKRSSPSAAGCTEGTSGFMAIKGGAPSDRTGLLQVRLAWIGIRLRYHVNLGTGFPGDFNAAQIVLCLSFVG